MAEKFGTIADVEELIAEMHDRRMKLVLDYVPNHTSIQNKFFQENVKYISDMLMSPV